MSAVVKCVAVFPHLSGIPADDDENTFVFQSAAADAATAAGQIDAASLVQHFYNSANLHHPLAWYLSSILDRTANVPHLDYYDITGHLDGSAAGAPVLVSHFTLGTGDPSSFNLPASCAAVLTEYAAGRAAAPVGHTTRPKQRLTGRIYLGPLRENTLGYVLEETHLDPNFVADLGAAASRLKGEAAALSTPTEWSVWSRANAGVVNIVGGAIDNRVDVQRRREVAATVRTPWS
jgi:hypothetical protein